MEACFGWVVVDKQFWGYVGVDAGIWLVGGRWGVNGVFNRFNITPYLYI